MGLTMSLGGAFARTAVRQMAAKGKKYQGSGGLFELRLHSGGVDPWQARTQILAPREVVSRCQTTVSWLARSAGYNLSFAPWLGAGVVAGYFLIQDALPKGESA